MISSFPTVKREGGGESTPKYEKHIDPPKKDV
jgi:hypothetical protein